jgi:hypothetical protein
MATAREVETPEIEAPPIKRGKGRPRTRPTLTDEQAAALNQPIESTAENPDKPEITGAWLDEHASDYDFFDLLQAYPPLDWEIGGLVLYLYRTAPIIDRGRTGQDYNLQKFSRPTDSDSIMQASYGGSGGYKLILSRFDSRTRHTKRIRDHYWKILNFDFPPRIPAGDWLDNDNNKEWAWARPKLEALARAEAAAGHQQTAAPLVAPAADPNAAAMPTILSLLDRFLPAGSKDQAQTIATEVLKTLKNEQGNQSRGLEAVVLKLLDRTDGGGNADLRAELAEARRFQNELLLGFADKPAAAPAERRSLAQELKDLLEVKSTIGQLFGRGGGPAESKLDWPQVGMHVAEELFKAAPSIVQAIALGKAGANIKQPGRPPAAGAATLPPGAQQQPIETPEEVREMIAKISAQFGPMFDEVTPFLENYFSRGVTGMHFRDWLIEEYGRRTYDGLRQLHPQTICDVIELRKTEAPTELLRGQLSKLTPPDRLMHFIGEFLSDDEAEFEDAANEIAASQPRPNGAARPSDF